jgi:SH3 domain-containing YSC84-like protein 1
MNKVSIFGAAFALAALAFTNTAAVASDQTELLDRAARTIEHMKVDPAFSRARGMLDNAKAVLVFPSLVKGGFIFGAEGGSGVLMSKTATGWSEPAFYTMGSASFGLQAGLQQAEVAMLIMSDRALNAIMGSDFKLGVGGGITVVNLGGGAEGNLAGDIIVWAAGSGLYGGLTVNGSVVNVRDDWNRAYYGRPVNVVDILGNRVTPPGPNPIRQQLSAIN